jgi:hypothetical protein
LMTPIISEYDGNGSKWRLLLHLILSKE